MKRYSPVLYTSALLLMLLACKKDPYFLYNDEAKIQFGPEPEKIYISAFNNADTLKRLTFYYHDDAVTQDTVFFDIYAIGGTSTEDRTFKLEQEQIPGVENAKPGVHYKDFNSPDLTAAYSIKSGTVHTRVPIVFLRDESLKSKAVELKFKVVDNNNFQAGENTLLWRKAVVTDMLSQPDSWDDWYTEYFLGSYSMAKHSFMIEKTNQKWDADFLTYLMTVPAEMTYWVSECKAALLNYNMAHPDDNLTDEFGELVQFP